MEDFDDLIDKDVDLTSYILVIYQYVGIQWSIYTDLKIGEMVVCGSKLG